MCKKIKLKPTHKKCHISQICQIWQHCVIMENTIMSDCARFFCKVWTKFLKILQDFIAPQHNPLHLFERKKGKVFLQWHSHVWEICREILFQWKSKRRNSCWPVEKMEAIFVLIYFHFALLFIKKFRNKKCFSRWRQCNHGCIG